MNIILYCIIFVVITIWVSLHIANKNMDHMQLQEIIAIAEHIYKYKFTKEQKESIESYYYRHDDETQRLYDTMELCSNIAEYIV